MLRAPGGERWKGLLFWGCCLLSLFRYCGRGDVVEDHPGRGYVLSYDLLGDKDVNEGEREAQAAREDWQTAEDGRSNTGTSGNEESERRGPEEEPGAAAVVCGFHRAAVFNVAAVLVIISQA